MKQRRRTASSFSWARDLAAVQEGRLDFRELVRKHSGLAVLIVRPWLSRCPANVGEDDLVQELWIEVWRAVSVWDPSRSVPLANYVRGRMRNRLLGYTHQLRRSRDKDVRFLQQQIIEEKVVVACGGFHDAGRVESYLAIEAPLPEEHFDVRLRAAQVIGALPSKQASVVAGICIGAGTDVVTRDAYGSRCKRPRKAALRAMAAALELVQSTAEKGPHASN